MQRRRPSTILPSLISTAILGTITIYFLNSGDLWPYFVPASLVVGIIGLVVSTKQKSSPAIDDARNKVVMTAFLLNILVYILAGRAVINSEVDESGLTSLAMIIMFFFILPFIFGAASLLAMLLIPDNNRTN